MCDFCNSDPAKREAEKEKTEQLAARFREFADLLDQLAEGKVKPHSETTVLMSFKAKAILVILANEWI